MPARILIVEDEYLIRLLLEDMLTDLGYEIGGVAANLAEARAKAQTTDASLAILDVSIGGQESFPAADILKSRGIPFVFSTGYGAHGLPAAYRDAPVLQKPFQIEQLQATLQRVLGAGRPGG